MAGTVIVCGVIAAWSAGSVAYLVKHYRQGYGKQGTFVF